MNENFYYKIPENELNCLMVAESLRGLRGAAAPMGMELKSHRAKLRSIKDIVTGEIFFIVKVDSDFSTELQGRKAYTPMQIKTLLKESNWAHNN